MGNKKIQEIDDSMKAEIQAIDNTKSNIIEKNYCLIMDNSDIVKKMVIDAPLRSPEHRVMLVKKGSVDHSLNYYDYHTSEGELLMIPANFIICLNGHSNNFNARVISFHFANTLNESLVGYDVVKLRLGSTEEHVFENYFQLMNQVLNSPITGKRDFEHIVISMLHRIQGLNSSQNQSQVTSLGDRKKTIFSQFIQLINADGPAPRNISAYAKNLGVSSNYLSIAVKQESGRTVMDWVNIRTITQIKILLNDPANLTVDQIAEQLQFSSSSQMIRLFKKIIGKTPLEYRKEKRKK